MMEFIQIALVDDHTLFRKGLSGLVNSFPEYKVIVEVASGQELFGQLTQCSPDIVLLDVNMPGMDGFQTLRLLQKDYPELKVVALSMDDDEVTLVKMIGLGARGYLLKDCEPHELKTTLDSVFTKGYSYSEFVSNTLLNALPNIEGADSGSKEKRLNLNSREMEFLKLVCKELTYKEIAELMFLSSRTIDGYRDALFQRLGVKNRVGLALYAVKAGLHTV